MGSKIFLLEEKDKYSFHYLSGHSLTWYLQFSGPLIVFISGLNIIIFTLYYFFEKHFPVYNSLMFVLSVIEAISFIFIGYKIFSHISQKTFINGWKINAILFNSVVIGFTVGFFSATYKWFLLQNIWSFYNLSIEPVYKSITVITMSLIGALIYKITKILKLNN